MMQTEMGNKETVIVAMSGGVDSSVAAGLLKKSGYNVVGATLKLNPCEDDGRVSWCCGKGAEEQSRGVAGVLDIPHYTIDASTEFENQVLKPAWTEYDKGRTPSPCIICNRQIKFRLLFELAKKIGATKVATGHYAIVEPGIGEKAPVLTRGIDGSKDQSYFLYSLSKNALNNALFPLGRLYKSEVRFIAETMGFANAQRPESQDACFVHSDGSFAEGLRLRFGGELRPGNVLDTAGNPLGSHEGIHRYTVGQRKGLGIALGKRAYVSKIDAKNGTVILCEDAEILKSRNLTATDVNLIENIEIDTPFKCQAKIRYRHKAADAIARISTDGILHVEFALPQGAIAPGQAVVLYDDQRVIGGGWINS